MIISYLTKVDHAVFRSVFDMYSLKPYANEDVKVTGKTKIYGIIGDPIEHSLSPWFQARFIELAGLDAAYVPFRVDGEGVQKALDGLWALNVMGVNVTVPHKESVLPFVACDESASLIGAVNTLVRGEDAWIGTNTDWIGFSAALDALEVDLRGASVLLLGAGGTAKAVVHALSEKGVGQLSVANRSRDRAERLAAHIRENYSHIRCDLIAWGDKDVEAASLSSVAVINTTSIGLNDNDSFPFAVPGDGVAIDSVYRPDGRTAFTLRAEASGRTVIDGLAMLIAQGAASFSLWHESEHPDRLGVLRWMESQLGRSPLSMSGWEALA